MVRYLREKVRLICWVMTSEGRSDRHQAIMSTWGRKCHRLLFMVGGDKPVRNMSANAQMVYLRMPEDYRHLWQKTKLAFVYVHAHYRTQYDWVLKIDDDSFVLIENLHKLMLRQGQQAPYFYGAQYKSHSGYNSGGPGYALSMLNLDKVVANLQSGTQCSKSMTGYEDIEMATCLRNVGIKTFDTRDANGGFRWSPFKPQHTINKATLPKQYSWFWGFTAFPLKDGLDCCADDFVSFHYVTADEMKLMEYLIYYAHPFSDRNVWNVQ